MQVRITIEIDDQELRSLFGLFPAIPKKTHDAGDHQKLGSESPKKNPKQLKISENKPRKPRGRPPKIQIKNEPVREQQIDIKEEPKQDPPKTIIDKETKILLEFTKEKPMRKMYDVSKIHKAIENGTINQMVKNGVK